MEETHGEGCNSLRELKIAKKNVGNYNLIIQCDTLEFAKKIGKLIVDEVPEIRKFKIKSLN